MPKLSLKSVRSLLYGWICATLLALPVLSQAEDLLTPGSDDWQPLYQRVDPELQAALDKRMASNPAWQTLVRRKKLGLCAVDMSTSPPRFARVKGNTMMYAASLPKIAILLGAYAAIDAGTLELTPELKADMDAMIRVSSNAAATRVLDQVGMENVQKTLRDPRYGFYDEKRGGGLWVGKRYAKSGPRKGDPMFGISHGATPTQVCRFYYLLANGRLINAERSEQILAHLENPGLHHKFVGELDQLVPKARMFRKSGTWRDFHSDSILVRGTQWRNYILVVIAEADEGSQLMGDLLLEVESLLHD